MSLRQQLSRARTALRAPRCLHLYRKYRTLTMVPLPQWIDTLQLLRSVTVTGDIVECGVWRAGMSAAMAETLPGRCSVLFDSFEGLPPAQEIDGPAAIAWQANPQDPEYFDNCTADESVARVAMAKAGGEHRILTGWFSDTVPEYAAEEPQIAVLRLDGDWYASTLLCLEHLWPRVVPGGLLLVDDYGTWDGCTRAVHEYLARAGASEPIRTSRSGVTFLVRRGQ